MTRYYRVKDTQQQKERKHENALSIFSVFILYIFIVGFFFFSHSLVILIFGCKLQQPDQHQWLKWHAKDERQIVVCARLVQLEMVSVWLAQNSNNETDIKTGYDKKRSVKWNELKRLRRWRWKKKQRTNETQSPSLMSWDKWHVRRWHISPNEFHICRYNFICWNRSRQKTTRRNCSPMNFLWENINEKSFSRQNREKFSGVCVCACVFSSRIVFSHCLIQ